MLNIFQNKDVSSEAPDQKSFTEQDFQKALQAQDQQYLEIISQILAGQYEQLPSGEGEIFEAFRNLAQKLQDEKSHDLEAAVGISMQNSESAIKTAQILSTGQEINHQTQSIAAATDEMVATVKQISDISTQAAGEAQKTRESVVASAADTEKAVTDISQMAQVIEVSLKISL